ncbi:branched-chain amino acid transport system ATP-binding protein [Halarchaeum rubridurum]|uniref:Probable branched-chain amino acid transport ATP-binding protein LivG n=1 Tax=Halarchaeum rubridurum TaxID=489911 RepID=A0A830FMR5_9EURY|nr:ABC transporter ATP-binding protein [Halarchaeum rubridurum]MBP1954595.1 branched-chain amino acid transport system ATP-binding protein [Halarchaeum rubridurum]GGM62353.1 ABC transporter ATP-binding protein [Halarchaeum rubridurum]
MSDDADPRSAALGTEGLSKHFGGIVAVDEVDLAVESGELRAIIGPNGAGKTTLFNVVTHALAPTSGSVYLDGEDVTDVPQERRPHLGLARSFQSNELFAELSVLENVRVIAQTAADGTFSFSLLGDGRAVRADEARDILARVGLSEHAETEAKNLSHGDQRRLGIAMAIATEPSVLLLDEPTSGMGPGESRETVELVQSLQDDLGLTVLMIEHDMEIVLSVSDRITVLNRGSVLATGTPDEIQGDDDVQDAYLGGVREEL